MLGIERGNTDLVILILIVACILIARRNVILSYPILLLASFLKLFPIVGVGYVLNHLKKRINALVTIAVLAAAFILFLISV